MASKKLNNAHKEGEYIYRNGQENCEANHACSWNSTKTILYCDECVEVVKRKVQSEAQTPTEAKKEVTVKKRSAKRKKKATQTSLEF